MMMACLEAGGMKCYRSMSREDFLNTKKDDLYHPNPGGFYEPSYDDLDVIDFGDNVVKIVVLWLDKVRSCDQMILMFRDPEEIRQSLEAFTGERFKPEWVNRYDRQMQLVIDRFTALGTKVISVHYTDVLNSPLTIFETIAKLWSIDPLSASKVVDPSQYRFRKELLTVGI